MLPQDGQIQQEPTVDPMSGNEVPVGAKPEEVRDDITAKVSEGEYIIPANVVRYLGIDKIEKMVAKAKEELASMEQKQSSVDEEFPFDVSELQVEEIDDQPEMPSFAEGGLVNIQTGQAGNTQMKAYKDQLGFLTFVPFVNGQPLGRVPEGSQEVTSSTAGAGSSGSQSQRESSVEREGNNEKSQSVQDISTMTLEEAQAGLRGQEKILEGMKTPMGTGARVAASLVPGGSLFSAAQRPIAEAYADRIRELEFGVKPNNIFETMVGGTKVGSALGVTSARDDLRERQKDREFGSGLDEAQRFGQSFDRAAPTNKAYDASKPGPFGSSLFGGSPQSTGSDGNNEGRDSFSDSRGMSTDNPNTDSFSGLY